MVHRRGSSTTNQPVTEALVEPSAGDRSHGLLEAAPDAMVIATLYFTFHSHAAGARS